MIREDLKTLSTAQERETIYFKARTKAKHNKQNAETEEMRKIYQEEYDILSSYFYNVAKTEKRVLKMLDNLPEPERAMALARWHMGWQVDKVAKALGYSRETVAHRLIEIIKTLEQIEMLEGFNERK
jgi:DNA-directed RNA polymerase specialized sigma24 family protein